MLRRTRIAAVTGFLGLVCMWFAASMAAVPVTGRPEDVGLSSERLKRIGSTIQRHVDEGNISGAVTLVARNGRVAHLQAHGSMDLASKTPMPTNAVFRIMSMTKPIVGAAILMMMEEGKLRLSRPGVALHPGVQRAESGGGNATAGGARRGRPRRVAVVLYGACDARDHHSRSAHAYLRAGERRRQRQRGGED